VRFYRILFVVGIVILAAPTTGHAHGEDVLRALIGEILVFIATIAVSLSTVRLPWQCRCFLVVVIVLLHAVSLQIVSDMPYRKNRNTIDAIIVGLPALGWLIGLQAHCECEHESGEIFFHQRASIGPRRESLITGAGGSRPAHQGAAGLGDPVEWRCSHAQ